MVQVGLNMGPRHARVLGWAKSYTKNLSASSRVEHDTDVVGAVSMVWALIKSIAPTEVVGIAEREMENAGLPRMATRDVAAGKAVHLFSFTLSETT